MELHWILRGGCHCHCFAWILFVNAFAFASTAGGRSIGGNLQHVYSKVDPKIQEDAANSVLQRLLPLRYTEFNLSVDPSLTNSTYEDAFEINFDPVSQKVAVVGTTGVSTLLGLNFYLKYYCNAHVSWDGNQLSIPDPLPRPSKLRKQILDRFRYYQNVCTDSYSFVWWDWNRWEAEIDWMALNGINLPLAFTGQEAIWQKVYTKLGLNATEINSYITGPAYLAWWRMGNLQKWAGPIPEFFVQVKLVLLHKILDRMRSLGMIPVLPAFAGHVPQGLLALYPNSTFERHPSWNNFNSSYSQTYMLDPSDPLFHRVGKLFIEELTAVVGTDHVYSCDAYNENRPASSDTNFLRTVAKATFESMTAGDPQAVWMMQAWVFTDFGFWTKDNVRAYLGGVEIGNLLVLDLKAESLPLFVSLDSFFNHAFIWCMLHNFGGTMNLYGNLDVVNKMLPVAREVASNGTLVGIGLTPEGINQNYVMYEFMTEMTLHPDSIQLEKWITKYSLRRYGFHSVFLEKAWEILQNGVYNNLIPGSSNHGRTILNLRPKLNATEEIWYDPEDISVVIAYFLVEGLSTPAALKSPLFVHDLVDLTRQFCIHLGSFGYWNMMNAYNEADIETFWKESATLLDLLTDLDTLLATNEHFLLGKWISSAESWGTNKEEKAFMRWNSLDQITTWGPNGEIVDYASKQWAGVVSNYLKPRWALFIDVLEESLLYSVPFNPVEFKSRVLNEVELPFTKSRNEFPTLPQGNSFDVAFGIYKKWRKEYVDGSRRLRKNWLGSLENRAHLDTRHIDLFKTFGSTFKLQRLVEEDEAVNSD